MQFDTNLKTEVELDAHVTPELKEEGQVREILRSIQGMRKEAGYKPQDKVMLQYAGDAELVSMLGAYAKMLQKSAGLKEFSGALTSKQKFDLEKHIDIQGKSLVFSIKKK